MAEDRSNGSGRVRAEISTKEDCEACAWPKQSSAFSDAPKATMKSVDRMAKDVEAHLKNRKS